MTSPKEKLYTTITSADSFRILELHKGSHSDLLSGTLHYQGVTLDSPCQYDALSYRWSPVDTTNPSIIKIKDVDFFIGPSLYAALRQFRHPQYQRYLWVDQICINQNCVEDKLPQLAIMHKIYSKAQKVLIWLGESNMQTDIAIEFFPMFVERIQHDEERSKLQQSSVPLTNIIPWKGALASCLNSLLSCPWFGRVWCLQEAAQAQKAEIWCGQKSMPFHYLETFVKGCAYDETGYWAAALSLIGPQRPDPENPVWSFDQYVYIISALKTMDREYSARILNSLRSLDCSEHQDRVYSVLEYLDPKLIAEIRQTNSLSPATVYHQVAKHEIQNGKLDYLGAAGLSQQQSGYPLAEKDQARPRLQLPSWVPDWIYKIRAHSYWVHNNDHLQKKGKPLYTAGSVQPDNFNWSFSSDGQILHGSGMVIDEVSDFTEPFHVMRLPEDLMDAQAKINTVVTSTTYLQSYITSCRELAANCVSRYGSQYIEKACRRSLVGDLMPNGLGTTMTGTLVRASDEAVDLLFEEFQKLVPIIKDLATTPCPLQDRRMPTPEELRQMMKWTTAMQIFMSYSKKNNLVQAVAEVCKGRRFFMTSSRRYMGVAPEISRRGDKICVIPGCCAPFVIRPKGDRYQLIGECYIDGIMDGEVIEGGQDSLKPIAFE